MKRDKNMISIKESLTALDKGNRVNKCFAYLLSVADAISNIMIAYVMKLLLDISAFDNLTKFCDTVIIVIIFLLVDLLVTFLSRIVLQKYLRKAIVQYKNFIFGKVLSKNINAFNYENISKYMSAFSNDLAVIEKSYLKGSIQVCNNLILLIGGLLSMIIMNHKLSIIVILASAGSGLVTIILGPRLAPMEKELSNKNEDFMNITKNMLSGFTVIKSFKAEKEVYDYFSETDSCLERFKYKRNYLGETIAVLSRSTSLITDFIVFTVGVFFVLKGEISIGVIIAFVQLINYVVSPLQKLGPLFANRKAAFALIEKMDDNVTEPIRINRNAICTYNKSIDFANVSFSYDIEKVLININLSIRKGKSYSIVGNSGSGKSTLLNLLLGYTDNYDGKILIDDNELRNCSLDSVYDTFSVIQQNAFIFDDSIINNITMYKQFDAKDIEYAIVNSGLKSLIEIKGLDYICGENGCNLSGGEKQRISIARCLLRHTPIILLDEATSSLDRVTSYEIEDNLLKIEGVTKVVITHKIEEELLRKYDEVIVLSHGEIIEQGSFDELITRKGYFYSFYNIEKEVS